MRSDLPEAAVTPPRNHGPWGQHAPVRRLWKAPSMRRSSWEHTRLLAENRLLRRRVSALEARLLVSHAQRPPAESVAVAAQAGNYHRRAPLAVAGQPSGAHAVAEVATPPAPAHEGEQHELRTLDLQIEQLAASTRLAALVAHELNTPLQAMENHLFLAGADTGSSPALQSIREEIDRIGAIVRRLLEFPQSEAATTSSVPVDSLIERVLLLTGSRLLRQRIRVVRNLAPDLPPIAGRDDQLTLVLLNLVLRAAAAMPAGGDLRISARVEPRPRVVSGQPATRQLTIELADTGSEALEASAPGGPFFSFETAGEGVRLEICRRLLTGHGGNLMLWDELGGGHIAVLSLPVHDEP